MLSTAICFFHDDVFTEEDVTEIIKDQNRKNPSIPYWSLLPCGFKDGGAGRESFITAALSFKWNHELGVYQPYKRSGRFYENIIKVTLSPTPLGGK